MAEEERKRPKWLEAIAGDARQAIVSLIVSAAVLAVGGLLLGVASSDVPLWLVGLVLILGGGALLATIVIYERRLEAARGELRGVREGVTEQAEAAKRNARERIDAAEEDARSRISATESFARVNVSEAEERTRAVSQQLEETRRQLSEAKSGQIPLTREAEAQLRSVRALVSDLDAAGQSGAEVASDAQELAFLAIVEGFQETFGGSTLFQRAYTIPQAQDRDELSGYIRPAAIRDLLTMLGQLDAYALNHGQASP